jgi:hypothetical protein
LLAIEETMRFGVEERFRPEENKRGGDVPWKS